MVLLLIEMDIIENNYDKISATAQTGKIVRAADSVRLAVCMTRRIMNIKNLHCSVLILLIGKRNHHSFFSYFLVERWIPSH